MNNSMQEQNKVKIFVATHKPGNVRHDEVYTPIHVGRAISKYKEEMADMIGDDSGDNISEKNSSYSEMTAYYWIWKNVKDVKYVGLCHYRRIFGIDISPDNVEQIMKRYDVIMIEPLYRTDSVFSCFSRFVAGEDLTILAQVIKKIYPDYYPTLISLCDGVKYHPFNMMMCSKDLFDQYAEWMFSILFECEKHIKPSPYVNGRRTIGYLAEMISQVYFIHNHKRIKSVPYYKIEETTKGLVKHSFLGELRMKFYELLLHTIFMDKVKKDSPLKYSNPAIVNGLRNDGIIIE